MRIHKLPAIALLTATLAGCALTPAYERPEVPVPAQWELAGAGAAVTADWWRAFGSEELNGLMDAALEASPNLAAARARIDQARAASRVAGAGRLPSVDASGNISRNRRGGDGDTATTDSDQGLISVGYELDLWGGQAAGAEAAEARVAASEYDRAAVALVLQSEVAANYFQALALKDRLVIAEQNLEAAREVLRLIEARDRAGAASGLELAQQRTSVHNIEAQLPLLRQQLRAAETALAVLLGRAPQGFSVQGATLANLTLPAIDPGQPTALLERRPDIRRAEAQLIAANADIGAARAALYPSLRLTASAGISGVLTGGAGSLASIAAALTQTIFDGGRLRGQVDSAQARREELVAQYAQAVLTALKETQDSLSGVAAGETRSEALAQAVEQAREATRIATTRYRAGAEDLLTVLDSQRSQLQAEDSLVQARLTRYTSAVGLYKALGGGWASP